MSLDQQHCVPCRSGAAPLTREQAEVLSTQVPEWSLTEDASRIRRTYRFQNFAEALAFVDKAGALAETQGHHPDITFGWGYCTIVLYTHKIGGLHENDFIMAAKCDLAYSA